MELDKDTRGWIMTLLSGIACTLGASVIGVDLIVRLFPGQRNFRIEDSNAFLSSSLSLSFGVMLFSSLYNMLPSSKDYLERGGLSPKAASWTLIGCFLGGVVGIQLLSRIIHHHMPSHVVDCDHSHGGDAVEDEDEDKYKDDISPESEYASRASNGRDHPPRSHEAGFNRPMAQAVHDSDDEWWDANGAAERQRLRRRPSMPALTARMSRRESDARTPCQVDGRCFGFSDLCGQECFERVQARGGTKSSFGAPGRPKPHSRMLTAPGDVESYGESSPLLRSSSNGAVLSQRCWSLSDGMERAELNHHSRPPQPDHHLRPPGSSIRKDSTATMHAKNPDHHHHVPANAFLSIGLQTSLAIALHKLPEGFITYATNHASAKLGFAVFVALFIHNIGEGFAMALPLYLAIKSRPKAMLWSALLGGASQPLGAGVAALWFHLAGSGSDMEPGRALYGGMFAVTSGVMTSVALQLFSESLELTHSRNLCMAFAFVGMGVMGMSTALTA